MDLARGGVSKDCKILVPGCGNSTLCEDLQNKGERSVRTEPQCISRTFSGYQHVSGMDYSEVVVAAMARRASERNLSTLRYFQVCITAVQSRLMRIN